VSGRRCGRERVVEYKYDDGSSGSENNSAGVGSKCDSSIIDSGYERCYNKGDVVNSVGGENAAIIVIGNPSIWQCEIRRDIEAIGEIESGESN